MYNEENEYDIELGKFDSFSDELDIEYIIWFICLILLVLLIWRVYYEN